MTTYALRLQNGTDTAARVRLGDLLTLAPGASPLSAAGGLRPDGGGAVTITNGTMTVNVAAFMGWVPGGVSTAQGGYPFVSDASMALTVDAGHATLARVDTVVARVRENSFDASGFTDADVVLVKGTAGSGAPTLPTNSLPLRNINVPAGASAGTGGLTSANLGTDRRTYLALLGAVTDSGWQTPTMGTNWSHLVTVMEPAEFRKIDGEVVLRGAILRSTSTSAAGETICTLPVGSRPVGGDVPILVYLNQTPSTPDTQVAVRGLITTGGVLSIAAAVPAGAHLGLTGIRFFTD